MLRADEKCGAGGESPRAIARHTQPHVALEAGDRNVVHAPFRSGQLGIAVGGKSQCQAGEGAVAGIATGQFPHYGQHRLLDAGIERVVIGGQAAARCVALAPGCTVGPDPLDALAPAARAAADGLQLGQRGGELERRNQAQVLAVHEPEQHLQHVFAQRVLARAEKHAGVVARRGLHDGAGIDRAAVGHRPRSSGRCSRRIGDTRPAAGRPGGKWSNRAGCGRSRHLATGGRKSFRETAAGRDMRPAIAAAAGEPADGALGSRSHPPSKRIFL